MNAAARLMALILALVFPAALRAVEIVSGPSVEAGGTGAIITWKTDSESGSRVRFGTSPDQLSGRAESPGVGTLHRVELGGLTPGAVYYFSAGTAKRPLATGRFTAGAASAKRPAAPAEAASPAKAPAKRTPPPTRRIWGNLASLPDHFARHGADFGARNADDYARLSWEFLQRAFDERLPAKVDDSDGTIRVWDPKTRSFAAYNRDGTTKTYFKPGSPDYFQRQPGRPTQLKRKD